MPAVIMPVRVVWCDVGIKKERPVHRRVMQRNGYVTNRRLRRPNVSIVKKAGSAKIQFRMPVPIETKRALLLP